MKNHKLLLIIPLLLLSILPVLPTAILKANAQLTGTVCITDVFTTVNSVQPCPAPEIIFGANGATMTIAVQVSGSDPLNGFNVQIQTDPTVVKATGISFSGGSLGTSILGSSPNVAIECIDGASVVGTGCSTSDAPGVLHLAAAKLGSNVDGNGLLFYATYNVLALTGGSNFNFLSLTVTNGTSTPDNETPQGATLVNNTDFSMACSPSSVQTPAGVTGSCTLTLTSIGGYTDTDTMSVTPSAGLTAFTTDTFLSVPPDGTVSTTFSASASVSGMYSAVVTATGNGVGGVAIISHSLTINVQVAPPDFTVSASPSSLTIEPGSSGMSTIAVGSVSGFTGMVSLAASVSPAGPTASLSPNSVTAGSGTSTLTVTVPLGTAPGMYTVTVTGTGSTGMHSATVSVSVGTPDWSIRSVPDQITVFRVSPQNSPGTVLDFQSINNYAGTISVTATIAFQFDPSYGSPGSSSLPSTFGTPTVTLTGDGTASDQFTATVAKATSGTGLYFVTVTATDGVITHTANIRIWVLDVELTPAETSITLINQPGTLASFSMVIHQLGAPYNFTGFEINPGFTSGTAFFPPEYYTSSANGARFTAATGLDRSVTSKRCWEQTFDSHGNEILPTEFIKNVAGVPTQFVSEFDGPVVHLNSQSGLLAGVLPPNFNGCRIDSFFYIDPIDGNFIPGFGGCDDGTKATCFDVTNVVIEPTATSPNGNYTVNVCTDMGGDHNCFLLHITLVAPPPSPPAFNQFLFQGHKLSLSSGKTLTIKAGLNTTITDPSLTAFVQVTAVSSDGNFVVVGNSALTVLNPGTNTNNIVVTLDFSGTAPGETYSISAVAFYGITGVTVGSSGTFYATGQSTNTVGTSNKIVGTLTVTA